MFRSAWLAAIVAFVPALVCADEPITIKIRRNQAGDQVKQTHNETETNTAVVSDAGGVKIAEQKNSKSSVSTYTEEIIAKEPGKRPTKTKRTYESAKMSKDGEETEVPLKGKSVLIERKGAKHSFKLADGGQLDETAGTFLQEEFKNERDEDNTVIEDAIVPKNPVKTGDTWKCDVPKLIEAFSKEGMKIDAKKSTASAKLLRVYKKGTATYGVLDIVFDFIVTDFGNKAAGPMLAKPATMKISFNMDVCIDGSTSSGKADVTMDLRAVMKTKQGDMDLEVNVVSKRTLKETNELLK